MRMRVPLRRAVLPAVSALVLIACQAPAPRAPQRVPPASVPQERVPELPQPPETPPAAPVAPRPARPPARVYRLGAAADALVAQARAQSAAGQHTAAAALIERAMRIEPANPLVWLELARLRQAEGRYDQAQSTAEKALSLAVGDARAQASAWRMIAVAQRARGRLVQAQESEQHARALSPR